MVTLPGQAVCFQFNYILILPRGWGWGVGWFWRVFKEPSCLRKKKGNSDPFCRAQYSLPSPVCSAGTFLKSIKLFSCEAEEKIYQNFIAFYVTDFGLGHLTTSVSSSLLLWFLVQGTQNQNNLEYKQEVDYIVDLYTLVGENMSSDEKRESVRGLFCCCHLVSLKKYVCQKQSMYVFNLIFIRKYVWIWLK